MRFGTYRACRRCGVQFIGQGFLCLKHRARRPRRAAAPQQPSYLTPAREAYRLQDPDLYRQALNGELD